jgi:predicted nucleic acid-binding protein
MEVLGFNFSDPTEEALLRGLLQQFDIAQTDMDLAKQVVAYRKIKKIKIPDAIILATASKLGAELVTANEADFKGVDNNVQIFVPDLILPAK